MFNVTNDYLVSSLQDRLIAYSTIVKFYFVENKNEKIDM